MMENNIIEGETIIKVDTNYKLGDKMQFQLENTVSRNKFYALDVKGIGKFKIKIF